MNRKASEEKMQGLGQGINNLNSGSGLLYSGSRKASIEQRYKSHLRGSEVNHQVGLIRNQSKPALQLPEIVNSSSVGGNKGMSGDASHPMLQNNRSKKNLAQGMQNSPAHLASGYSLPQGQDPKLKNYYDMLEKNRQKSIEKYQNDLTKIYLVSQNNPGS